MRLDKTITLFRLRFPYLSGMAARPAAGLLAGWFCFLPATRALADPLPIGLGAASGFAVLAGATVTNTGATVIDGNIGVWPGSAVTGFPPGVVTDGQIYAADATAMQAAAAAGQAYQQEAGATGAVALTSDELGGLTLTPGVYALAGNAVLDGTLRLDAGGAAGAVFIFQIGSTLTTATLSAVQAMHFGADDEVIWQVGYGATLGTQTSFLGDILAGSSITLDTGASISCGAALAGTGAVTLDSNVVSTTGNACGARRLAVPEPGSLALLLAGVALLLGGGAGAGVGCKRTSFL